MMDLVVEGRLFLDGEITTGCVGVKDGRIAAIKKVLKGDENIDAGDMLVLPAGIDPHVHFRDPGHIHKEDFATGTMAAAFGGMSMVIDMPNTNPFVTKGDYLEEKIEIVDKKACIDFGLFAGPDINSDIAKLADLCTAFKIYTAKSVHNVAIDDEYQLSAILQRIAQTDKVVTVHCEEGGMVEKLDTWDSSLEGHCRARPNKAEARAIQRVHRAANGAKLNIAHVSAKESLPIIEEIGCSFEMTPHHLFLDNTMDLGGYGKVNPPLREKVDRLDLWHEFVEAGGPMLASDHAPHTMEEKEQDFADVPGGIPNVETMIPLMLERVKERKMGLARCVEAFAGKAGKLFGLNKGRIAEGCDADLMVVDLKKLTKIKGDALHSKCGWTPYEGWMGVFPYITIVRGSVVVKDGSFEGSAGHGTYVH
jgi:dihydroorotase